MLDGRWSALLCSFKGHDWQRRSGQYTFGIIDYDRFYDVEDCRRCGLTRSRTRELHPELPASVRSTTSIFCPIHKTTTCRDCYQAWDCVACSHVEEILDCWVIIEPRDGGGGQ